MACACPQHESKPAWVVVDPEPHESPQLPRRCIRPFGDEAEACGKLVENSDDGSWSRPVLHRSYRAAMADALRRVKAMRLMRRAWLRVGASP